MNALRSLFSGDEKTVDSVIVAGIGALVMLIVYAGYQLALHPELFNPIAYAGGASGLVASIGGSKRFRDGPSNLATGGPANQPGGGPASPDAVVQPAPPDTVVITP
jgi:hypothetical protein